MQVEFDFGDVTALAAEDPLYFDTAPASSPLHEAILRTFWEAIPEAVRVSGRFCNLIATLQFRSIACHTPHCVILAADGTRRGRFCIPPQDHD